MKVFTLMAGAFTCAVAMMQTQVARADFGEVDLIVRESVEAHFREYGRDVDLKKFSYIGQPRLQGKTLMIRSSVWGEQRLIHPWWGWYECTTRIDVVSPGHYTDLGSDCLFDAE